MKGLSIESLHIGGRGDATLFGSGAGAQIRFSTGLTRISVLELDGRPLATPISLPAASSSGLYTIVDNPGQLQPWSLSLEYDIDAALANADVDFKFGATKLSIVLESALSATSGQSSIAYVANKDFHLTVETEAASSTPLSRIPGASSRIPAGFAVCHATRQRRRAS